MSQAKATKQRGSFAESTWVIVQALLIALVIRTFLFQTFSIPSGSMEATLLVGDYLFVSKFSYGYTHFSLPFSPPLFSGRVFGSQPNRGDVVVFRLPRDNSVDYIKRVIGLPGDKIQMLDGLLYINGEAVKRERADDYIDREGYQPVRVKRWHETLPNGVSYYTLDRIEHSDAGLCGAAGSFLHDGRQPRQFARQPDIARQWRRRIRAVREPDRRGQDHLFLGSRRRASLADMALAVVAALGAAVQYRPLKLPSKRLRRPGSMIQTTPLRRSRQVCSRCASPWSMP